MHDVVGMAMLTPDNHWTATTVCYYTMLKNKSIFLLPMMWFIFNLQEEKKHIYTT
jgi:hypothetical protein